MSGNRDLCSGCRDDFYNQPDNTPKGQCWDLENATVVTRYRIDWWTAPTEPGAFRKVTTNSCHYAPGRYAHYEKLPDFVKPEDVR